MSDHSDAAAEIACQEQLLQQWLESQELMCWVNSWIGQMLAVEVPTEVFSNQEAL